MKKTFGFIFALIAVLIWSTGFISDPKNIPVLFFLFLYIISFGLPAYASVREFNKELDVEDRSLWPLAVMLVHILCGVAGIVLPLISLEPYPMEYLLNTACLYLIISAVGWFVYHHISPTVPVTSSN